MIKTHLKLAFLTLALLFFGSFPAFTPAASLLAPERAETGRLQKAESDVQGDWLIYPPDGADLAKDTDEKTLYFVPLRDCELTIIFFGVENAKPVITQTRVLVGPAPDPSPSPEPSPGPNPSLKLTDREKTAARAALNAVINGVENDQIKTANGCRSTFKQTLMARGQVCDGRSCHLPENLQRLADDWTARTNFESAETIKTSFEGFLKEVD